MHFHLPLPVQTFPTKHLLRRLRKSFRRNRSQFFRLCFFFILFCLIYRRYYPVLSSSEHGLTQCLSTRIAPLDTFDNFVSDQKAAGFIENNFENRFQEDIWDTLVASALFPAWSDMRWNLPQYARSLSPDLRVVQAAAARISFPSAASTSLEYRSPISKVTINYVHHRLDRLRGLQYVANFSPGTSNLSQTLFLEKGFDNEHCNVHVSSPQHKATVYVLLPYKNRDKRLRLFFQNYLMHVANFNENLILIVSILRGSQRDKRTVLELKEDVFIGHPEVAKTIWLHENNGDIDHAFSRGVAIREASTMVPGDDDVIFHCDVDMLIQPTFFDRCRHNSIPGKQVYYPVFYSLYPYANASPMIAERNGFWRKTSFGMTCMRKKDFFDVGAYDDAETRFHGWGSEDVYQFEKVRNTTHLVAFRAVDPALLHRWHSKNCDPTLQTYTDCMKTNFATMGHPVKVGPVLLKALRNVDDFFTDLQAS